MREVLLYEDAKGKSPIQDLISTLKPKEQQKVIWGLKLIADGFPFKEPYFKKIVNVPDLWELRLTFGGNAYRIFLFEWKENVVIVTNGIIKRDSKNQNKAIERAHTLMTDFKERKNEDLK